MDDFDVIVVGARCAGAPTAMLLARESAKGSALTRSSSTTAPWSASVATTTVTLSRPAPASWSVPTGGTPWSPVRSTPQATIDLAGGLASELAEQFRSGERVERIVGRGVPNFFRTPFGAGWALVGDAGYTKDPVTVQGIGDAFQSAEWCSAALRDVLSGACNHDDAMSDYQQRRDAEVLPLYEFTTQLATLEPPPPEMQQLLAAISGNQPAMDDFVGVNPGTLCPAVFFDPDRLAASSVGAEGGLHLVAKPGVTTKGTPRAR
jgi:hypothetical protein